MHALFLITSPLQIEIARYAHVPIGNLPNDYPSFVCDIFFARSLRVSFTGQLYRVYILS